MDIISPPTPALESEFLEDNFIKASPDKFHAICIDDNIEPFFIWYMDIKSKDNARLLVNVESRCD